KTGMPGQFAFRYETLSSAVDHVMQQGEFVIAYGRPINANAFVNAHQMRGGVKARMQSGDLKDRSKRRRRGPFSVRACDQHARELALGMFERAQQYAHVF